MFKKKMITAVLFSLLSVLAVTTTAYAAGILFQEDSGPVILQASADGTVRLNTKDKLLASTYHQGQSGSLSLIRRHRNNRLYFMITDGLSGSNAFVEYSPKVYNFYLNKNQYGSYPPLIFLMSVPRDAKGKGDDELGEWRGKVHHIPVYALFDVVNGRVMCDDVPFYSASYLNPLHYHDKIKDPVHARLIQSLMSQMPDLHEVVRKAGITLPN